MMRFIVLVVLALLCLGGCAQCKGTMVKESRVIRAVESQGYKNVRVISKSVWFVSWKGCSSENDARFVVRATNALGKRVELNVRRLAVQRRDRPLEVDVDGHPIWWHNPFMCYIEDMDLEPVDFWDEGTSKARKKHVCNGCRSEIKPGEVYLRHASKCDGEFFYEKLCPECIKDRQEFSEAHHGFKPNPALLHDFVLICIEHSKEDGEDASQWEAMEKRITRRLNAARKSA